MDINLIQETIWELEDSDTTFSNVQELAALYIVKDGMCRVKGTEQTETEYRDILPKYRDYIVVKRRYQLTEAPKEAVICHIRYVCREIQEFLCTLYNSTDMPEEREQLEEMFKTLYFNYVDATEK